MHRTFSKFAIMGAAIAAIVGITVLIIGQPASKLSQRPASRRPIGVPEDWSHHHLVFSNPGTYEEAAKSGASYAKWLTIRYDTRFILQQMRRRAEATVGLPRGLSTGGEGVVSPSGVVGPDELTIGLLRQLPGEGHGNPKPKPKPTHLRRDWSESLLTGTVQPNAYPAKWGLSTTSASCSDFVVYPTGTASTSIVVYNNLYNIGCSGTVPSVYGAYYTDGNDTIYTNKGKPAATVSTSPIISLDGSQLAFMQSNGTNSSSLVLLKLGSGGTVASPVSPTVVYLTSYRSCSAPCMTELGWGSTYPGNQYTYSDTFSAPFYDYSNDALYVGDDEGDLYKFENIFGGTPDQPGVSPENPVWPLQVSSNAVASPVYDSVSGLIFVGDTGGYLYAVGSGNQGTTEGTLYATSAKLGGAIIDAPLVDSTAGMVYVFVTTDSHNMNAVYQFPTSFGDGASGKSVEVGNGGAGYLLYAGDFDNVYYSSSTPGSPSGNLYVVGNTGGASGAALYQIPINSNVMKTPTAVVPGLTGTISVSGSTVASSATVTLTTSGSVSPSYAGALISDADGAIPTGDTITAVTATTLTLETAATGTNSNETLTIGEPPWSSPLTEFCNNGTSACAVSGGATTTGTDYLFFSGNTGNVTGCTASSGNGCVFSYNISNPSSVSFSAGMNVTNIASPGCWASGGLVIDNSVPSGTMAGASQVYFINLNGNTAGGAGGAASSGCASGSGNPIQGVQASQSSLQ
jgi:hypothetical protein